MEATNNDEETPLEFALKFTDNKDSEIIDIFRIHEKTRSAGKAAW